MAKTRLPITSESMRGMTLIEVLVALVIIAVALSAAIRSVNAGVVNTDYLKQKSFAHWVVMNEVAEQQVQIFTAARNEWKQVDMAGRRWHINTKVVATDSKSILRVETKVFRKRDESSALASMVSFVGVEP